MKTIQGLIRTGIWCQVEPGVPIFKAIEEGLRGANKEDEAVVFEFNGTPVVCNPGDSPNDVYKLWYFERVT